MNNLSIPKPTQVAAVAIVFTMSITSSMAAFAATLAQEFNTVDSLPTGGIVSLNKQASQVVLASRDNQENLYGVVVSNGDLSFNNGTSQQEKTVPVANNGVIDTLVSNNAGSIKTGDAITVDDVAGVGQKATKSTKIIGIAQADFNEQSTTSKQVSIVQNGSQKYINVSTIPVKLGVNQYVIPSQSDGTNGADSNRNKVLQVADSLVGKQVKPFSLVIAGLILLIGIFVSVFLITSSGYASMISIGRNPLSEKKIIQSLIRMLVISVAIFATGIAVSYAILKFL